MTRLSPLRALRGRLERRYLEQQGFGSGRAFVAQLVASVGAGDVFLDAGCGEGDLRRQLAPHVHYIGLDRYVGEQSNEYLDWKMRPSVVGDVCALPIASGSCATVALMHVLEHVQDPLRVFSEIFRVLRPTGKLFVDVPFFHPIHHAPHDFFRYTPHGLRALAERAGFEVVEVRASGGYFRALSRLLEEAPSAIRGGAMGAVVTRLIVARPLRGLGWAIRKLQYLLDLHDAAQNVTCGYHCIFRKPGANDLR